jgi:hypothetical protein
MTIITEKGRTHNQLKQKSKSQPHEFDFILKSYSQPHVFDFILKSRTTSISFTVKKRKKLVDVAGGWALSHPEISNFRM